jgi:hypothetical protein
VRVEPTERRPVLWIATILAAAAPGCRTPAPDRAAPEPEPASTPAPSSTAPPGALRSHDCREACAWGGQCVDVDGTCRPTTDAECKQSQVCKLHAACHLGRAGCEATAADCRAGPDCAQVGACTRARGHVYCEASSDADCARSEACRTLGRCALMGTMCWKKGEALPPMEL